MLGFGCICIVGRYFVWWSWWFCEFWWMLCVGVVLGWVGGSWGVFCVRVCCGIDEWVGLVVLMLLVVIKFCCGNFYKVNVFFFKNG